MSANSDTPLKRRNEAPNPRLAWIHKRQVVLAESVDMLDFSSNNSWLNPQRPSGPLRGATGSESPYTTPDPMI
jgi:hypothetical protein